jgi:hypothetical protein
LDDRYVELAYQLSKIHGSIRVTKEKRGIHFYMASPVCLEQFGKSELHKMHLAVNAEKAIEKNRDRVAMCMKTDRSFKLSDLLAMPPLHERGYQNVKATVQVAEVREDYLEDDGRGNKVPKSPGDVVPVYQLAPDHPARQFLQSRGFCPYRLYAQFRLSYGLKERADMSRIFRRLPHGFKVTPQGRIIFFFDMLGVSHGWQARIMEVVHENRTYYFHPYRQEWTPVKERNTPQDPWRLLPGFDGWDPVKYLTGHGTRRNEALAGLDAAIASGARDVAGRRYCLLVEGPFDAGRLGPPGIAHVGKYLSPSQAEIIATYFDRVIYIRDNDAGGEQAIRYVKESFEEHLDKVHLDFVELPTGVKDAGEMSDAQASAFLLQII